MERKFITIKIKPEEQNYYIHTSEGCTSITTNIKDWFMQKDNNVKINILKKKYKYDTKIKSKILKNN